MFQFCSQLSRRFFVGLCVLSAMTCPPLVAQTDTTFTYQGTLDDQGAPANGAFNLTFALFNALSGGSQIGSTIVMNGVAVTDGLLTVGLDFGASAFNNDGRWLEIAVNGNSLSPRQPISRSPYSIQTRGIFIGDDGNVTLDSMSAVEGTMTLTSIGGIDLIIDADTNNSGEDQNARIVMRQDGGQVVARMGYREGANSLEIMQEWNSNLIFGTGNQDRVTITSNGFVGIGTSTPNAELNVVGDGSGTLVKLTNGGSGGGTGLAITDVSNGGRAANFYGVTSNDLLRVQNDGTGYAAAFIGNVGIGTTTPNYPLEVVSAGSRTIYAHNTATSGFTYGVRGESDSTTGTGVFGLTTATSGRTFGVWGDTVSTSGRGVIGSATATSGGTIGVRGQSNSTSGSGIYGFAFASSGVNYGVRGRSNSTSGFDFYASGAGTNYGSSSSIRWKSNIRNIDKPLEKIARLRGVYYTWDADHGGHHDLGMIAEEVGEVLPEIVAYEENGIDAIGMDYSKMTPLLVEAINALRSESDRRLAKKDDEISDLRQQLADLQQIVERLAANQEKEDAQ